MDKDREEMGEAEAEETPEPVEESVEDGDESVESAQDPESEDDAPADAEEEAEEVVADAEEEEEEEAEEEEDEEGVDADEEDEDEEDEDASTANEGDSRAVAAGLLDQPLIVEGKRKKHSVDRLRTTAPMRNSATFEVEVGRGIALGEIDTLNDAMVRVKSEDLKILHRLLFGTEGRKLEVKKHVRLFSGFAFNEKDDQFEAKRAFLNKYALPIVKEICGYLCQAHSGTKAQCIERILQFLMKPTAETATAVKDTGRRRSVGKSKTESSDEKTPRKRSNSTASPRKTASATTPKKTPRRTPLKSPTSTKRKSTTPRSTTPKRPTPKKSVAAVVDSDSSDEEPLSKKAKTPFPSDGDLESAAQAILDNADMDTVSVKSVMQQVAVKYGSHDLSEKKAFMKSTIKELYTAMAS